MNPFSSGSECARLVFKCLISNLEWYVESHSFVVENAEINKWVWKNDNNNSNDNFTNNNNNAKKPPSLWKENDRCIEFCDNWYILENVYNY